MTSKHTLFDIKEYFLKNMYSHGYDSENTKSGFNIMFKIYTVFFNSLL